MGLNGVRRAKTRPRGDLVAALDVGTSKVACFIARIEEDGRPRVLGIGHQASRGVRCGSIIDLDAAALAIGHAVNTAEQMASVRVREVLVNLGGGHLASQTLPVDVAIAGQEVGDADLRRILRAQSQAVIAPDDEIVHAIPVSYAIDGHRGIRDPRGMYGERLSVELHVVTALAAALRNTSACIGRAHLEPDAFVVAPYAAGLACLVEDEMELGAAVIDMGAGTTGLAVFCEGNMVFADSVPVGGVHVTNDIARGLTTPLAQAERMKTLHGSAIASLSDEREIIDVPQVGEDEPGHANHVPKSLLTGIIQPRLEEVFELVRGRLEASGLDKAAGRRVVLTGGASQLQGARELAQAVLDKQVRMGRPAPLPGLAEATTGPAFATAVGLLAYAVRHQADLPMGGVLEEEPAHGWWGRIGGWLREYI